MIRFDAGSVCPQYRDTSHLMVPDEKTKGWIMSLKVKCTNGDREWRGELVDYNKHITDKCPNRVVQCQYNCGLYFMASEVSVHEEEECTKRPSEVVEQCSIESEILCKNLAQVIREKSEPVTFHRMSFFLMYSFN